ncbi:AbrB family transcriptional regulator [Loktanella agnita]|uniref:AbrB family transcriptional regulator n=1 Tax=Loktanella agnita TaxID=287097 RepID=UPI0039862AC0
MNAWGASAASLVGLVVLGAVGSLSAVALGLPVPLLIGPAILTTLASLMGLPLQFPHHLRNFIFLLAGIAIGATVSPDSVAALVRWPLAFALLGVAVLLMVILGQRLMVVLMPTDRRSGLLAAAPGHLSYVIALGEDLGLATRGVAVVQSIRLLALTLLVPFAVALAGIETGIGLNNAPVIHEMTLLQTTLCIAAALALAPVLMRTPVPAPMLLAGMIIGAAVRLSGLVPGGLSHWIAFPVLAAIGTLIGTRFAGVTLAELRRSALAGLAGTTLAAALAVVAAWFAAGIVEMPMLHVLVAFSPGGLETMAVIGAAIGANPGFVAAAHVARLLFLSVLIPVLIRRTQEPLPASR